MQIALDLAQRMRSRAHARVHARSLKRQWVMAAAQTQHAQNIVQNFIQFVLLLCSWPAVHSQLQSVVCTVAGDKV